MYKFNKFNPWSGLHIRSPLPSPVQPTYTPPPAFAPKPMPANPYPGGLMQPTFKPPVMPWQGIQPVFQPTPKPYGTPYQGPATQPTFTPPAQPVGGEGGLPGPGLPTGYPSFPTAGPTGISSTPWDLAQPRFTQTPKPGYWGT